MYNDTVNLVNITRNVVDDAKASRQYHNKPVIMTEYGADTLDGLHRVSMGDILDLMYNDTVNLVNITRNVVDDAKASRQYHNKPVIMTEYGADTLDGLHRVSMGDILDLMYNDTGNLVNIARNVIDEAKAWRQYHNKPVIMTEYGADTLDGLLRVSMGDILDLIYNHTGTMVNIARNVIDEAKAWRQYHNKPVIMTEYGADTLDGLHRLPEYVWSEEYQVALMSEHFKAFDKLRRDGFFNGEFIWNFADFMTAQTYTRVGGNKKGIFTRQRQPKASAHHLRARYLALAAADSGAAPPDTNYYVSDNRPAYHEEL
ncbi:glycosyl hydrolases family 2, TIM barrel domain-containing protein [Phthorimaea operculella]|nr:glycosyl hydrolases family 2, TIM barrel domain-containing protein [Phthorimaea operculella]